MDSNAPEISMNWNIHNNSENHSSIDLKSIIYNLVSFSLQKSSYDL